MTYKDVHPGYKVKIESWASLDGCPREVEIKLMGKNYFIPEGYENFKLSYDCIKEIIRN